MTSAGSRIAKAIQAAAAKRTREAVVFMACAVCGRRMRRWKSQIRRARLPMSCGVRCRAKVMTGPMNPRWKGGRWRDQRSGYTWLRVDLLSARDQRLLLNPRARQVLEHRLIAARMLGRPLRTVEMVHHRNGVKDDNRPRNLAVTDWSNHSKEHRLMERRYAEALATIRRLRSALVSARRTAR